MEERERYIENCFRLNRPVTEEDWQFHLKVMSFHYVERAHCLLTAALDPSGESIEAYNEASSKLTVDLERYFHLDPADLAAEP
jgi:hypothetical protein